MSDHSCICLAGSSYPPLGKGYYDAIIFGLGFRECLLACLLLKEGKKILVISKKQSFAWDNTSFDLLKLFGRFRDEEPTEEDYEALGSNNDYHIDLIPKVILSYGKMASLLKDVGVYDDLTLKPIDMHGAYSGRMKRVGKLPSSSDEANRSSLLNIMQRLHCRNFLASVEEKTSKVAKPVVDNKSLTSHKSIEDVYSKYGISEGSQGFIGHGIALYDNNDYLEEDFKETYERIRQYMNSISDTQPSPFLYPVGGKSNVCKALQGKLLEYRDSCDIMLKQTSKQLVFENGVVCGVIVGDKAARSPVVIGDSTWFRDDRQKKTGKCIRSICILNHPIDGCESGKSAVIGFFRKQLIKAGYKPRESDINGLCLSWKMNVCPKGIYVAVFSTTVETQKAEKELKIVYDLLGTVLEQFDSVTTLYRPKKATKKQGIFIFSTPDASVTLDSIAEDVTCLYKEIMERDFSNA